MSEVDDSGSVDALTCIVVADHPPLRDAVSAVLTANGIEVVATSGGRDDALAALETHGPDVLVVDLALPLMTGLELVAAAVAEPQKTGVVVYTGAAGDALLAEAFRAGARGFVSKDAPSDDLVQAVRAVAAGHSWLDRRFADAVGHAFAEAAPLKLSDREREILALLADGKSNHVIADALSISADTVRTYIGRAMKKLEADTRTQAVATALRLGLIE